MPLSQLCKRWGKGTNCINSSSQAATRSRNKGHGAELSACPAGTPRTLPPSSLSGHICPSPVLFPEEGRGAGAAEQDHAGSLQPSRDQRAPPPGVCSSACADAEQHLVSLATSCWERREIPHGSLQQQWHSSTAWHLPPVSILHAPQKSRALLPPFSPSRPRLIQLLLVFAKPAKRCRKRFTPWHRDGTTTSAEDHCSEETRGGKIPVTRLSEETFRALTPGHAPQYNLDNLQGMQTSDSGIV